MMDTRIIDSPGGRYAVERFELGAWRLCTPDRDDHETDFATMVEAMRYAVAIKHYPERGE